MRSVLLDRANPGRYRYSSSLVCGLALLQCFTAEHQVRGIAEMAEALGLERSTAHRYASTHRELGYLEQTDRRKYRLSAKVLDIGLSMLESIPVRRASREALRELRDQTERTACLWVLTEGDVVCIDHWHGSGQGQYEVDAGTGLGTRLPSYCTAAGKALLANLPAAERKQTIRHLCLKRCGPKTLISKAALLAELERIGVSAFSADAARSVALEDEEVRAGRRAVAAAIVDKDGQPLAAIQLSAPASKYTLEQLASRFGPEVAAAAQQITPRLGSDEVRDNA